jgi:hypothetical protein
LRLAVGINLRPASIAQDFPRWSAALPKARKPPGRAWLSHQRILAASAVLPAGVTRNCRAPLGLTPCSIQPFLTKFAIVALPAG